MSREIKFRAWDVLRKKMRPVLSVHFSPNGTVRTWMGNERGILDQQDETVLLQFTGLKDKNGVEIYEGDIVHSRPARNTYLSCDAAVVRWDDSIMCFEASEDLEGTSLPGGWDGDEIPRYWEVIGNIYENPELLKV